MADTAQRDEFRQRVDNAALLLFALVNESIGWATAALLEQDVDRANRVIAEDRGIDDRCNELTGLVRERLSAETLDGEELEFLIAVLQIVPELERSADLAEHIAQRALGDLGAVITPRGRGLIQSMSDTAVRMWQIAGAAYQRQSRDASFELAEADDELDAMASRLVHEGAPENVDPQVMADLALVARFYERLGDHAVNLARRIDTMAAPRRVVGPGARSTSRTAASARAKEPRRGLRRVLRYFGRFRLVPTDEGFFGLFDAAAANAHDCAEVLSKLITSLSDLDEHYEAIKGFERRGDQITRDVLRQLDTSFVTPFDREDIHKLAEEIDDVVDDMFSAAELIQMVHIDQPLAELGELAELLVAMTDEMAALIAVLRHSDGARYRLERIEHLERQGDVVFRRGMGRLFGGDYEAIDVIKYKDILQALEESLNAIEDVSDVIESILVKHA